MAHTILFVEFCLLLPNVIAIQTLNNNIPHVFLSSDKMFCAEAPENIANDALDLFKSMPRGKLYDGTSLMGNQESCKDMGYTYSAGEDPCYPGLQTFYRSWKEANQFYNKLQITLKGFAETKDLNLRDANLADACHCNSKSYSKNYYGKSCNKPFVKQLMELSARNNQHTFVSLNKLWCAQAPKTVANDALNLFKSMPRGKLYFGSALSNTKTCKELGYRSSAGEDPCYPGLRTFYRNKEEGQQFFEELQSTLKEFGETNNMTVDDANLMDTCKCKEKSFAKSNIGKFFTKSCDKAL